MLQVKVNSQFIELPDDFAITMNLKSPVFGEMGSSSYPFRFSATPRNKAILGFFHRIENMSDPYREYPVEIYFSGILLFVGLLKCRVGNAEKYEGQIYEGRGDFFYQAKNKALQNYSFGGETLGSEYDGIMYARDCMNHVYPERPVAFPQIYNDAYFEEQPENQNLWCFNKYFPQSQMYLEPGLYIIDEFGDRMIIVPCLYFKYVLKTLFTRMGYSLDRNFFDSHPDFNKLVLYNSVNANEDPASPLFNVTLSRFYWDYHLPRIAVSSFMKGYENFFGIRNFINPLTNTIDILSLDDILKSPSSIEFSKNITSLSVELEEKIKGFHFKMNLDPGDSSFERMITEEQDPAFAKIKAPVLKPSELPPWPASACRDIRFVEEKDTYWFLGDNKIWSTGYGFNSLTYYTEFLYKMKDQSVETNFSTLWIEFLADCQVTNKMSDWLDVTPRLFFALDTYGEGNRWIASRNDSGNYSLLYNGSHGLYEKFYKKFVGWRTRTKYVKVKKLMSVTELRDFDFSKKYSINGIKYLFIDLQVTLKMKTIQPAALSGLVGY